MRARLITFEILDIQQTGFGFTKGGVGGGEWGGGGGKVVRGGGGEFSLRTDSQCVLWLPSYV